MGRLSGLQMALDSLLFLTSIRSRPNVFAF